MYLEQSGNLKEKSGPSGNFKSEMKQGQTILSREVEKLLMTDLIQSNQKFLLKRKEEIENQLISLNDFGQSNALTEQGSLLASALVKLY